MIKRLLGFAALLFVMCAIPAHAQEGWWIQNETSGTSFADHTANGNTGTGNAITNNQAGPNVACGAAGYNGTSSYIDIANPGNFIFGLSPGNVSESFSIVGWVYVTDLSADRGVMTKALASGWSSGDKQFFVQNTTGKLVLDANGIGGATSTSAVSLNTWTYVAMVYDSGATTVSFYLNAVADAGNPHTLNLNVFARPDNSGAAVRLGERADGADFLAGRESNAKFFQSALSGAQVTTDYNGGVAFCPTSSCVPALATLGAGKC